MPKNSAPDTKTKIISISTNRNTGVYDLATASEDLIAELLGIYVDTAASGLTAVSIQTDDTTPVILLTSAEGVVAGLTTGKNLTFALASKIFLKSGKKIQLSILTTNGTGGLLKLALRHTGSLTI